MAQCMCPDFPEIEESAWDDKEVYWEQKSFYTINIPVFFRVNGVISPKIIDSVRKVEQKGLQVVSPLRVMSREGWIGGQIMVEVNYPDQTNPRVQTLRNSRFFSHIYRGKQHLLSLAVKDLVFQLEQKGEVVIDIYYWYLTCQQCVKKNGYKTVILAMLEEKK